MLLDSPVGIFEWWLLGFFGAVERRFPGSSGKPVPDAFSESGVGCWEQVSLNLFEHTDVVAGR